MMMMSMTNEAGGTTEFTSFENEHIVELGADGSEPEKQTVVKKAKIKNVKSAKEPAPAAPVYQAEALPQGTSVVEGITEASTTPKKRKWYIIHTYSGHENKVKINLERRIETMEMGHKIFRIEVPQTPVTTIKDGKRVEKEEHLFPGYVLVEMLMEDDSWYCVRYTPGVTKFVGGEKKPIPARESEIKRILMGNKQTTATKIQIDLKAGDTVQIISGPFSDFTGTVTEVQPEKEKLRATVSIFGRETPVELVFSQVQKKNN
jgi:transcriptional antiterminator NusG